MSPAIEDVVADALRSARTDPRFHVNPAPDAARRVRRAATAQRRRTTALALTGVAVVGGGTAVGVATLRPGPAQLTYGSPWSAGAVPGITPAWAPASGADWLLSDAAYQKFVATHSTPSPAPHTVPSPAQLTDVSARLLAEVRHVVPGRSQLFRQDAPDGLAGAAAIHGTLDDATPIEVRREPLQQPIDYEAWFTGGETPGTQPAGKPTLLPTGSAYIEAAHTGYGWGDRAGEGARTVMVVTPRGEATTWNAPLSVPLQQVVAWAVAADAFEHAHPDAVDDDNRTVPTAVPSASATASAAASREAEAAANAQLAELRAKVAALVDSIRPAARLSPDTATDAQAILTVGKDHVTVERLPQNPDPGSIAGTALATGSHVVVRRGVGSGFGMGNVVEVNAADGTYTKWFATDGVSLALLQKWATALDSAEHA